MAFTLAPAFCKPSTVIFGCPVHSFQYGFRRETKASSDIENGGGISEICGNYFEKCRI